MSTKITEKNGTEDRIVVCFTIRARVAVKRHIGIVGVGLVIVPTAVLEGYGAKVGLGNMRVKAENRMVTGDMPYRGI